MCTFLVAATLENTVQDGGAASVRAVVATLLARRTSSTAERGKEPAFVAATTVAEHELEHLAQGTVAKTPEPGPDRVPRQQPRRVLDVFVSCCLLLGREY